MANFNRIKLNIGNKVNKLKKEFNIKTFFIILVVLLAIFIILPYILGPIVTEANITDEEVGRTVQLIVLCFAVVVGFFSAMKVKRGNKK